MSSGGSHVGWEEAMWAGRKPCRLGGSHVGWEEAMPADSALNSNSVVSRQRE